MKKRFFSIISEEDETEGKWSWEPMAFFAVLVVIAILLSSCSNGETGSSQTTDKQTYLIVDTDGVEHIVQYASCNVDDFYVHCCDRTGVGFGGMCYIDKVKISIKYKE